jgi:hypothetical protein
MKQHKPKDNFWFVLAIINILAMVYPMTSYLQADSLDERLLAVLILFGAGFVLAIIDTVSIAVAYLQ